jgi:hypothetical protein
VGVLVQQEADLKVIVRPVGITPFTTCPHCSILIDGTCVECPNGDVHPSCVECVDGKHRPPWYKGELLQTILISVAVGVASAIILRQIESRMRKKR